MDIYCAKCSEPWDSYGVNHGDMTKSQAEKFKQGLGCPACDFGKQCVNCSGTGMQPKTNNCQTCFSLGYVICRKLTTQSNEKWFFGYTPNITYYPNPQVMKRLPNFESLDGWVNEVKAVCPDCQASGESCFDCKGTGKFISENDNTNKFLSSMLESDDDPDKWIWDLLDLLGV